MSATEDSEFESSLRATISEGAGEKNWRQWLAVVSEGDAMGPLWVRIPIPKLAEEEILAGTAEKETFVQDEMLTYAKNDAGDNSFGASMADTGSKNDAGNNTFGASMVDMAASSVSNNSDLIVVAEGDASFLNELEQLAQEEGGSAHDEHEHDLSTLHEASMSSQQSLDQGPPMTAAAVLARLDDDEPEQALRYVEEAIVRLCEYSWTVSTRSEQEENTENAVSIVGEATKLLSEEVFRNSRMLRWEVKILALSTRAAMLYAHAGDYNSALIHAERALIVCVEEGMCARHTVAVCRLQIAACAVKLGNYSLAFKVHVCLLCVYVCVYIYTYIHTYIHIKVRTHTHTYATIAHQKTSAVYIHANTIKFSISLSRSYVPSYRRAHTHTPKKLCRRKNFRYTQKHT